MTAHPAHIHVVTSIEAEASGPSYSVVRLAQEQAARGGSTGIYSLSDEPCESVEHGVYHRRYARSLTDVPGLSRLEFSRGMQQSLFAATQQGALLHVHGLWRMPNVYPGLAAEQSKTPLVLSPRGMLGGPALAFSTKQKRAFWHIWQRRALRALDCVHVTAKSELEDVRAFGLTAPAAIIPNGIDVPEHPLTVTKQDKALRQVLHLGRIHPKKGIDRLLRAWSLIDDTRANWELLIIGPSERGYMDELKALAQQLNIKNVRFEGPIYGDEKQEAYANADVFVLPSLHENFGMVIAEALAQGTPVISTKGAPWEGLITERCGWWIEHGSDALAAAIMEATALSSEELFKMGSRGRDWMRRDFSWDAIAEKMEGVYQWCTGQGERPGCVVE